MCDWSQHQGESAGPKMGGINEARARARARERERARKRRAASLSIPLLSVASVSPDTSDACGDRVVYSLSLIHI